MRKGGGGGFTLIELLVVLSIISILMGIMMPVLVKVRRCSRTMRGMNNQRQIVRAVNLFAVDNDEKYPESVATIGVQDGYWNWQEPTMMTSYQKRSPRVHRSMSAYLRRYIEDASIMYCPNAPRRYRYLQASWEAGDGWDNPETPRKEDPMKGTYCFYWNYIGCLEGRGKRFIGPRGPARGRGQSKLLVSDYFGFDHWRSPKAYGSCERFNGARATEESWVSSAYWWRLKPEDDDGQDALNIKIKIKIKLHAGYVDGHVGSYSATEVVGMKVSLTADGSKPYPDGVGPGLFYLPRYGLH